MGDQFRLRYRPIDIDRHPRWATHYIQEIEIVDSTTGQVVETIKAFDTNGCAAVQEARQQAFAWIAQRCEEAHSLPLP